MSALLRPCDPKEVLDALAFQRNLLALATGLEAESGEARPFSTLPSELRRLEQVAHQAAQALRRATPSATPE